MKLEILEYPHRALIQDLPELDCQGKCQPSCGVIVCTEAEKNYLTKVTGEAPTHDEQLVCNYLNQNTGKCEVYEHRPLICRLYGLAQGLECKHGCKPKKFLTLQESSRLIGKSISEGGPPTKACLSPGNPKRKKPKKRPKEPLKLRKKKS